MEDIIITEKQPKIENKSLTWQCVIKESLSTYIKILSKFYNFILTIAIVTLILTITTGLIYILTNIEKYLEYIVTTLINIIKKLFQYFITTSPWIWIIIIGIWVIIGIVPFYSYIKCRINELPTRERRNILTTYLVYGGAYGGLLGLLFGTIGACLIVDPVIDTALAEVLILFGIFVGCIFGLSLALYKKDY